MAFIAVDPPGDADSIKADIFLTISETGDVSPFPPPPQSDMFFSMHLAFI